MGGTSGPRSEVSRGQDNREARPERVGEGASFTQDGDEATGEAVRDRRTPRLACPQEWLPAAYSEGGTKLRDPREGEMLSRSLVNKRLFWSTGSPACRL